MAEVRDARAAHDLIARRASAVAAIFYRLGESVPLPLVARELARLDVPVFPCAPGGKRPIPERGFHEAITDAGQVEAWWRQRPRDHAHWRQASVLPCGRWARAAVMASGPGGYRLSG